VTYLEFHLVFILPVLAVLAWPAHLASRRLGSRGRWAPFAVAALAFVYTTPWDNYLVWRGVWGYSPGRVLGTLGYVPYEEYAFFLLQPVLTGFFTMVLLDRAGAMERVASPRGRAGWARTLRWGSLAVGALLTLLGAALLTRDSGTYMGLILVWACPMLALMGYATADGAVRVARPLLLGMGLPTLYLWVADRIAIGAGTWVISDRFTLGLDPLGLPLEEATFFLVTNVLVVLGLLLFLVPGWPGAPALRLGPVAAGASPPSEDSGD
jgi:lycopene cyclase domain-containing protein